MGAGARCRHHRRRGSSRAVCRSASTARRSGLARTRLPVRLGRHHARVDSTPLRTSASNLSSVWARMQAAAQAPAGAGDGGVRAVRSKSMEDVYDGLPRGDESSRSGTPLMGEDDGDDDGESTSRSPSARKLKRATLRRRRRRRQSDGAHVPEPHGVPRSGASWLRCDPDARCMRRRVHAVSAAAAAAAAAPPVVPLVHCA